MLNMKDIMETITMIQEEHLDIRTITMGISLLDCCDTDIDKSARRSMKRSAVWPATLFRQGKRSKRNTVFPS